VDTIYDHLELPTQNGLNLIMKLCWTFIGKKSSFGPLTTYDKSLSSHLALFLPSMSNIIVLENRGIFKMSLNKTVTYECP